ncbi:Hypothetical protein ABZS17I87_00168 [Kosakonia cowanii]
MYFLIAHFYAQRFASGERAMQHPSLLESTTTGHPFRSGRKTFSQEA